MSKKALFNELAKHFDDPAIINNAEKVLEYVSSPKIARELPEAAREQYKQALDMVQGPIEQRAAQVMPEIPFDDLVKAHAKQDAKMAENPAKITSWRDIGKYNNRKIHMEAHGPERKMSPIADLDLSEDPISGAFVAYNVRTKDMERRKGLASELYRQAEKIIGEPIKPSRIQLEDGVALWKNAGKVKPFGNKRHPEAAFDVRFKNSNDILAGAAPLVVAGSLMADNAEAGMGDKIQIKNGKDKNQDLTSQIADWFRNGKASKEVKKVVEDAADFVKEGGVAPYIIGKMAGDIGQGAESLKKNVGPAMMEAGKQYQDFSKEKSKWAGSVGKNIAEPASMLSEMLGGPSFKPTKGGEAFTKAAVDMATDPVNLVAANPFVQVPNKVLAPLIGGQIAAAMIPEAQAQEPTDAELEAQLNEGDFASDKTFDAGINAKIDKRPIPKDAFYDPKMAKLAEYLGIPKDGGESAQAPAEDQDLEAYLTEEDLKGKQGPKVTTPTSGYSIAGQLLGGGAGAKLAGRAGGIPGQVLGALAGQILGEAQNNGMQSVMDSGFEGPLREAGSALGSGLLGTGLGMTAEGALKANQKKNQIINYAKLPDEEYQAAIKSADELGINLTPGMKAGSVGLVETEQALADNTNILTRMFGPKKAVKELNKQVGEALDPIAKQGVDYDATDLGLQLKTGLQEEIGGRFELPIAFYQEYTPVLKTIPLSLNAPVFIAKSTMASRDFITTKDKNALNGFMKDVSGMRNLFELERYESQLQGLARDAVANNQSEKARTIGKLVKLTKRLRDRSINEVDKMGKLDQRSLEVLAEADNLYRSYSEELKQISKGLGLGEIDNKTEFMSELKKIDPRTLAKKGSGKGNIEALIDMKRIFPDQFALLKKSFIGDLVRKSSTDGNLDPQKFLNNFNKLDATEVNLYLSPTEVKRIQGIGAIAKLMPKAGRQGVGFTENTRDLTPTIIDLLGYQAGKTAIQGPNAAGGALKTLVEPGIGAGLGQPHLCTMRALSS